MNNFNRQNSKKKEKEKKREKRREEKLQKKEEKKNNPDSTGLEGMLAYVDQYGNITDTPPDENEKKEEIDSESIEISIPKKTEEESDNSGKGYVKFFDTQKGFGFINSSTSDNSYFFHQSNLIDDVVEGDKVEFNIQKGLKGLDAVDIKLQE